MCTPSGLSKLGGATVRRTAPVSYILYQIWAQYKIYKQQSHNKVIYSCQNNNKVILGL